MRCGTAAAVRLDRGRDVRSVVVWSFPASLVLPYLAVNVLAPVSSFGCCGIVDISTCP